VRSCSHDDQEAAKTIYGRQEKKGIGRNSGTGAGSQEENGGLF
jgi:hypothetical protein